MDTETYWFDHEKLEVYREAIAFIAWLSALPEGAVRIGDVKDQLDRASTSIPLNIAEGKRQIRAERPLPVFRYRTWIGTGVCGRVGCSRGKIKIDDRSDS